MDCIAPIYKILNPAHGLHSSNGSPCGLASALGCSGGGSAMALVCLCSTDFSCLLLLANVDWRLSSACDEKQKVSASNYQINISSWTQKLNKGICSIFTLAHDSSCLLISTRDLSKFYGYTVMNSSYHDLTWFVSSSEPWYTRIHI